MREPDWAKVEAAAALIGSEAFAAAKHLFQPEDAAGMGPLFAAIGHGCAAGRQDEAFAEVYRPRVTRGNADYASSTLGLRGAELAAIAQFFDKAFATPAARTAARPGGLSEARQALVLNAAGERLRALGGLEDAVAPARAQVRMREDQQVWAGAASGADNLAGLLLTLGHLADGAASDGGPGALAASAAAIAHAGRAAAAAEAAGNDKRLDDARFEQVDDLTNCAELHHRQGEAGAALTLFRAAEARQRAMQPSLPLLYSVPGYRCIDLRLAQGRAAEAAARAEWVLSVTPEDNSLDIALHTLALARAKHLSARQTSPTPTPPLEGKGLEEGGSSSSPFRGGVGVGDVGQDGRWGRGNSTRARHSTGTAKLDDRAECRHQSPSSGASRHLPPMGEGRGRGPGCRRAVRAG